MAAGQGSWTPHQSLAYLFTVVLLHNFLSKGSITAITYLINVMTDDACRRSCNGVTIEASKTFTEHKILCA